MASEAKQRADLFAKNLKRLEAFGWICEAPSQSGMITGTDKKLYRCAWCEGLLFGVPRAIYLSVDCGLVMLIGELKDVPFERFIEMLGMEQDPDFVKPVEVVDRQKSLFKD